MRRKKIYRILKSNIKIKMSFHLSYFIENKLLTILIACSHIHSIYYSYFHRYFPSFYPQFLNE